MNRPSGPGQATSPSSATSAPAVALPDAHGRARRPSLPTRGAKWDAIWPLGLYALLSLVLFGLPIIGHPRSHILAADEIDSSFFLWAFGWWPHALLHGLNPFVTQLMFVPDGFNLTWATSMPLPSILLAPITLAFGPAATWNVIQLLAPMLSAWTAFLLCRHVTRAPGPSLVGGFVFGFSPYMLVHLTGGPYLALVPLVPVFVLLVLKRLDGSLSPRRFVLAMTLALVAQCLISSEVLATSTLFGAAALVVAFLLFRKRRRALLNVAGLLVVAYAATAVLLSPFLYYFFFGDQYPPGATYFTADLAGFSLPPPLLQFTRSGPPYRGANTETYLGILLIALIVAFAWQQRRSRTAWLLVICLLLPALASLGGRLTVRGDQTGIWLPWSLLADLPVLRYAITLRFALFVILPAALIVAMWLARGGGLGRWALALLVVASFIPKVGDAAWNTKISNPAFFRTDRYRSYLKPADRVLTIPAWGPNERWQADTKFRFKLAAGYAGNPFPPSYARYPTWNTLLTGRLTPDYARQLRRFTADKGVTAIVVDQRVPGPWTTLFGSLGVRPVNKGGVLFYRLREPPNG
jgi:hypothetical protein